jgi:serine/threonine protein kinase
VPLGASAMTVWSRMPLTAVVGIVAAAAGALDYADERGLLPRDVKPATILLGEPEHRISESFGGLRDQRACRQAGRLPAGTPLDSSTILAPLAFVSWTNPAPRYPWEAVPSEYGAADVSVGMSQRP